jgi:hypothetical protein
MSTLILVNTPLRIIVLIIALLASSVAVFAWEVGTKSWASIAKKEVLKEKSIEIKDEIKDKTEVKKSDETKSTDEKEVKKERVGWDANISEINASIVKIFKLQSDRDLRSVDLVFTKRYPDLEKRIEAYDSIQNTYEVQKKRIQESEAISTNSKAILAAYLNYMIQALEKRKDDLEEL